MGTCNNHHCIAPQSHFAIITYTRDTLANMSMLVETDPAGDVVLVCGYPPMVFTAIRVNSHILKLSSPMFKRLLSPPWQEGCELEATGQCVLPLPDDSADAMIAICNVLHHHNERTHDVEHPNELLNIVKLAHKYECVGAIIRMAQIWIARIFDFFRFMPNDELCVVLEATYYLNDARIFEAMYRTLVEHITDGGIPKYLDERSSPAPLERMMRMSTALHDLLRTRH